MSYEDEALDRHLPEVRREAETRRAWAEMYEDNERRAMALEAEHYGETRKALMADPFIRDMAEGVRHMPISELAHESGTPRSTFMMAALREYTARCEEAGIDPLRTHIGGPAEAILALMREENA